MTTATLGLIYARAANGVIGRDGGLPWHLPEDLAHFKAVTLGAPVIMGRKTWDSLPPKFRPLPGRRNIVVTRQADWTAGGAERAASLEQAVALCHDVPRAWVIGGAELYAQAEPLAQVAEVTEIDQAFDGDARAPTLGPGWREVSRARHVAASGLAYSFVTYHHATHGGH
ncbi:MULTISPECIES: dihydrofolate reductase [Ramlibacter]|jgi:dihydrofolate reductase|uniref:Dihydrofolate reductase n=1 Tax=Ramlibacter pinisoli TaxID=2682844 RepID=A0A6N8IQT9_9BURK|nr:MULTISPECIES: dihydrofolate reductase [Ramlibacter]MBA2963939.1 dihydrofolate reductase [Ramlibacter sp. CGMCC 1.13660]MVQ28905.1 dihydrofolate reductase [Ramlibacter pinisoli]